jgi:hypothetical protein
MFGSSCGNEHLVSGWYIMSLLTRRRGIIADEPVHLWVPEDPGSLYAYFDFTDPAARAVTSGNIDVLLDKGPSNRDIFNTGANRPTVAAAARNGYDVGNFVASDQCLISPTLAAWPFHKPGTAWTFIMGSKQTHNDGAGAEAMYGNGSVAYWHGFCHTNSAYFGVCQIGINDSGMVNFGGVANHTQTRPAFNNWAVYSTLIQADASPVSGRIQAAVNGGSLVSNNTATGTPITADPGLYFTIGGIASGAATGPATSGSGFHGQISHLLIYNAKLDTENWQAARDFVNGYVTAF